MGVVVPLESPFPFDDTVLARLQAVVATPELFVVPSPDLQAELRALVKVVYDDADLNEFGPLPELLVDGLDLEQIWEEIELRAEPLLEYARRGLSATVAAAERSAPIADVNDVNGDDDDEYDNNDDGKDMENEDAASGSDDSEADDQIVPMTSEEDDGVQHDEQLSADLDEDDVDRGNEHGASQFNQDAEHEDQEDDSSDLETATPTSKRPGSCVDDEFFKLDDMDGFADEMEINDDSGDNDDGSGSISNDDSLDIMHQLGGDDDDNAQYGDFFDKTGDAQKDDCNGANDDDEFAGLSQFRKRQLKLAKEIEALEERSLAKRPWELMGEAKVSDRPVDSLIDAQLDFQMADKQPKLITEDVTRSLEDLIRQRIRDRAFDDVERKFEPKAKTFKAHTELETDKSEVGLAELYEKEYVAKASGVDAADEDLSKEHKEIATLFASLSYRLDALSNFHFTPKETVVEVVTSRANVPAIAMEEAIPTAASAGDVVAPEELFKGDRAAPAAETELERDERRSRRRHRKARGKKEAAQKNVEDAARAKYDAKFAERQERKAAIAKVKADRSVVQDTAADTTQYTRSSAFFRKIQDAESSAKKPKRTRHDDAAVVQQSKPIASSASYKL